MHGGVASCDFHLEAILIPHKWTILIYIMLSLKEMCKIIQKRTQVFFSSSFDKDDLEMVLAFTTGSWM